MKYIIAITTTSISGENETTITTTEAKNMREAYSIARKDAKKHDGVHVCPSITDDNGNVDYDGLIAGALMVARCTTANMIKREGGKLQDRLYREVRRKKIDDHDVKDIISEAKTELFCSIKNGKSVEEAYDASFKAVNKHLRAAKQINLSKTAMRTPFIEDIDGDIIPVNNEISRIIKKGERYYPTAGAPLDEAEKKARKREMLLSIIPTLTPTQRTVWEYLAKGYSNHQISSAMGRDRKTVIEHIRKIQAKAKEMYPDYKP